MNKAGDAVHFDLVLATCRRAASIVVAPRPPAVHQPLRIGRRTNASHSRVVLDPAGDHRMAFAFALLGLLRDEVDVANSDCVAKSWPAFWEDLAQLGAKVAQT